LPLLTHHHIAILPLLLLGLKRHLAHLRLRYPNLSLSHPHLSWLKHHGLGRHLLGLHGEISPSDLIPVEHIGF